MLEHRIKVNMHHKHDIALKWPNYILVYYKIFNFWKFMPESIPASSWFLCWELSRECRELSREYRELSREYKELSMGKQRADHGKPKSWSKNRHIYGRNALLCKFLKIKHFMINWNIFEAFLANVVFMVDIHFNHQKEILNHTPLT